MGRVGRLLSFVRALRGSAKLSDVKVDRGGGDNRTPEHFSSPGDDSFPLPGDFVALLPQHGTGRDSAVGYIDPKNTQTAAEGEKRIYSRNPATGAAVAELHLKNDGSAVLSNASGILTLQVNGDFNINGVIIKASGDVTMPNSLVLNGKELDGHTHTQADDSGGNSEADTGGNQ